MTHLAIQLALLPVNLWALNRWRRRRDATKPRRHLSLRMHALVDEYTRKDRP